MDLKENNLKPIKDKKLCDLLKHYIKTPQTYYGAARIIGSLLLASPDAPDWQNNLLFPFAAIGVGEMFYIPSVKALSPELKNYFSWYPCELIFAKTINEMYREFKQ